MKADLTNPTPRISRSRLVSAVAGWFGAFALCFAPFVIDTNGGKALAMLGLLALSLPALHNRIYSILFCNIVGFLGYGFAILS